MACGNSPAGKAPPSVPFFHWYLPGEAPASEGRNKKKMASFTDPGDGLVKECDSREEADFAEWLRELKERNLVEASSPGAPFYHPGEFRLFPGKVLRDKPPKPRKGMAGGPRFPAVKAGPHAYTPDFYFRPLPGYDAKVAPKAKSLQPLPADPETGLFVDVKGEFTRFDAGRSFSINRKWVLEKSGAWVRKAVPFPLFKETFLPGACVLTKKTKKPRAKFAGLVPAPVFFGETPGAGSAKIN